MPEKTDVDMTMPSADELLDAITQKVKDDLGIKTQVQQDTQRVLDLLAEAGGKMRTEDDVKFIGREFILPEKLTLQSAAAELTKRAKAAEELSSFSRKMLFRPWDGARATAIALRRVFGMFHQVNKLFMMSEMIDVYVGPGQVEQVPWGAFEVPGLDGVEFYTGATGHSEYGQIFEITAVGPRKWKHEIEGVFNVIQNELEENSIYRGKVFDGQSMPQFLDLTTFDPKKVVYSEDVFTQFEANVWSLLKYTDKMRELEVTLKRAVLFEGPYGTGKTMGAFLTAQIAEACGWTFIYVRPGRDSYQDAIATAKLYQPAVVFVEDVDTFATPDSDVSEVSKILDLFDGISAKNTEILLITTTNHVEKLHKGMLRPGRLDAVIHVGALDINGVERLARSLVTKDRLAEDIDWERVGLAMDGFLPAFVKEAVDRAIKYSLSRNKGELGLLETEDLVAASVGLRPQLELMDGANDQANLDSLSEAFKRTVSEGVAGQVGEKLTSTEKNLRSNINNAAVTVVSMTKDNIVEALDNTKMYKADSDGDKTGRPTHAFEVDQ